MKHPNCSKEDDDEKCSEAENESPEYEEAIETLMQLTGVGKKRAEELYRAGFKDLKSIAKSDEDELAGVNMIGKELAKKIKKEAEKYAGEEEFVQICPVCGAIVPLGADRCPKCGTPVSEFEKIRKENEKKQKSKREEDNLFNKVICPFCGALIPKGSTTCPVCGADLRNVQLEEPKPLEDPAEVLKRVFGISELPSEKVEEDENVDIRICPNCGAIVVNRDTCPVCGAPVPKVETKPVEEEIDLSEKLRVCPNCGAFVSPSAKVCPVCGTPLEEKKEEEEEGISLSELKNMVMPAMPEEMAVEEVKESEETEEMGVEELKEIENVVAETPEIPKEQVIDEGALNDILTSVQPEEEQIGPAELEEISKSVEGFKPNISEKMPVKEETIQGKTKHLEKPKTGFVNRINTLFSDFGSRQDIVSFSPFFASFLYLLSIGFLYGTEMRILYISTSFLMAILSVMSVMEIYTSRNNVNLRSHLLGLLSLAPVAVFIYPSYTIYAITIFSLFLLYLHYRYSVNYWIAIASYSLLFIIFPNFISGIVIALCFGFVMHIYQRYRDISLIGVEKVKKVEDFYSEGLEAFMEKRYHEAIYLLSKSLEIKPHDKLALNTLGLAYARAGNDSMALEIFKNIVDMDPKYKYAWNNMGNVYARIGDYEKAVECYKKALKIDPNYDDALLNLGYVMIRTGSYSEAVKLAEKIKTLT